MWDGRDDPDKEGGREGGGGGMDQASLSGVPSFRYTRSYEYCRVFNGTLNGRGRRGACEVSERFLTALQLIAGLTGE